MTNEWVFLDGEAIDCPPLLYCPECWEKGRLEDPEMLGVDLSSLKTLKRLPLIVAVLNRGIWFCSHCHRDFDVQNVGPTLLKYNYTKEGGA
jgi:hypothetical protein